LLVPVLCWSLRRCWLCSPWAGCGPKKTATPAPSTAATTAPGRVSSSTVQGGAGAAKTCTAGHTQAIINGRPKCLAAGQTCSSKAIWS